MEDDGVESESVQEREREGEVVQLVAEDSSSDPDGQLNDLAKTDTLT